jgi:transposase-like protein
MKKSVRKPAISQEVQRQLLMPVSDALRKGLMEAVFDEGLKAIATILEAERTAVCGPRYVHQPERRAVRHGHANGELVYGGSRVQLSRPRARGACGAELQLPSWRVFSDEDPLNSRAVEQMVVGVSTRKYGRSLEPLGLQPKRRGVSKSAVSRRFVATTAERMETWKTRSLKALDLVVLMVDGIHFAENVVLVALGIDASGAKHVLGLWEGATENSTSCTALMTNLRERGLNTERSILVVIDGAKALRKAVVDVFGSKAVIQRCQVHKRRNVLDQLPDDKRASTKKAMDQAYATRDVERARRLLNNLARVLSTPHPGAAASLKEGLEETLTVMKLRLPDALAKTLVTTNAIENLMSTNRRVCRNVKRWRDGSMILRWLTTAAIEAESRFHRLKGHKLLPTLVAALREKDAAVDLKLESA